MQHTALRNNNQAHAMLATYEQKHPLFVLVSMLIDAINRLRKRRHRG